MRALVNTISAAFAALRFGSNRPCILCFANGWRVELTQGQVAICEAAAYSCAASSRASPNSRISSRDAPASKNGWGRRCLGRKPTQGEVTGWIRRAFTSDKFLAVPHSRSGPVTRADAFAIGSVNPLSLSLFSGNFPPSPEALHYKFDPPLKKSERGVDWRNVSHEADRPGAVPWMAGESRVARGIRA